MQSELQTFSEAHDRQPEDSLSFFIFCRPCETEARSCFPLPSSTEKGKWRTTALEKISAIKL